MIDLNDLNMVFIVGCSRSGTSILGEILTAGSETELLFEFPFWNHIRRPFKDHVLTERDVTREVRKNVKNKLVKLYERDIGKKIIVEKNSRNSLRIKFLSELFPKAKFIHIIRNGKDVACSLVPGLEKEWRHLKPSNWETIEKMHPVSLRGAVLWKSIINMLMRDLPQIDNEVILIRYENLINDTRKQVKRLCDFSGIPFTDLVKSYCDKVSDETKNSYHAVRQSKWFRNNHSKRIGRWKQNLKPPELQLINRELKPLLNEWKYK